MYTGGPRRTRTASCRMATGQAGKMLVPLLSVLAALAMGVAAVAIYLQMQERDRRLTKERELQLALAENDGLKTHLQQTEQEKAKVEEELVHIHKDLAQSKAALADSVAAQETLTKSIEDREREINRLVKDLEQAKDEADRATTTLSSLQKERDEAKRQLADVEHAKSQLESKVMELSAATPPPSDQPTVELDKILVTNEPSSGGASMSAGSSFPSSSSVMPVTASSSTLPAGQVVVVNREYDFIVINLGKNHGLSVGQEFQIVRGDQVLGKAKVEKIYDELSAAAILPESQKNNIREGDAVKAL